MPAAETGLMKEFLTMPMARLKEWVTGEAVTPPWPVPDFCFNERVRGGSRHYRRYILLSHARSGTNMLQSALHGHPQLVTMGECLHPAKAFFAVNAPNPDPEDRWRTWRNAHPISFVRDVVYRGYAEGVAAVGFKIFPEHLDDQPGMTVLWDWLAGEKDIAVISLYRQDLLSYYLSLRTARRAGKWMRNPGDVPPAHEPIRIEPEAAEGAFERRLRYRALVRERFAHHPFMELTYEDLTRDTDAALTRIQSFLGVEALALRPDTVKQEVRPIRESISNHDELVRHWRGTRWESVLRQ